MTKITSINQACRELAKKFPDKFEAFRFMEDDIFRIMSPMRDLVISDMCACDFDEILEVVGVIISIDYILSERDITTWSYRYYHQKSNEPFWCGDNKFLTKKEASPAAFKSAVEYLINQ